MVSCTIKIGIITYATLVWLGDRKVAVTESAKAKVDGFANSFARDRLFGYDPRTGTMGDIKPELDKYSLMLWCSQWVQNNVRNGGSATLLTEGIDFSEVLPETEPGVLV